ncbi:MAG: hypothetical protein UT33_C0005G0169 [Candidatus Peregrinibacteria bacterium GW2011_GWC2_39_14]|nr:MAG: hypothetical protein US92_C0001G0170 [Candidatus Peregrinibacteria bacterium GW2011_GWA2_38_36]KKR07225.1 MAG: hypothetical protein UT33_C0005G0169 [Candidatus Peregrinibacteria bacterium GW2011_GWC2_39_14]
MESRMCKTVEQVRTSQKLQGAVAVLRGSSKKPEFKEITVDQVTGSVGFFRRAFVEFLTIEGGKAAEAEADSQGGVNNFSEQVENVERLVLQDQIDRICIDKGYSSVEFAKFLAEALEFDKLEGLKGIYKLAEGADKELAELEKAAGKPAGFIKKVKEGGRDYAKRVIAAYLMKEDKADKVIGIDWAMIDGLMEDDNFFTAGDFEFIELCSSFRLINGLAHMIEMDFNRKKGGIYVEGDSSAFADRMYKALLGKIAHKSAEFKFDKRMKKLETLKEIFKHFGEKGFFCIDDFPVVEPSELGALRVTHKKGWIKK